MKYLSILILAALLVSCSSGEEKNEATENSKNDSTDQSIDSVTFVTISFNKKKTCDSGIEHKLSFDGLFPQPTGKRELDSLLAGIYLNNVEESLMMNDTMDYASVDSIHEFNPIIKRWAGLFLKGACDAQKGFDLAMNWELDAKNGVTWNQNQVLTIYFQKYSFTGGAHGNSSYNFINLDLDSVAKIQIEDVIIDTAKFKNLGDQKLREFLEIDKNTSFIDAGLDVEEFPMTENFGFTKDGLVLYYNAYEIGPYSMGTVELVFGYDELKGVINPKYIKDRSKEDQKPV